MPERDGYIPGVPCWIDTSQSDPEAAVDFYSGLFGWEFEDVMPPESKGKYFIARLRGGDVAAVGSIPEGAPPMARWNTYVWVQSVDQTATQVLDAGGRALMDPFDVMDAGRMAVFADPEGAAFCVWQAKQHKGARIVNEAGSLNFNGLNTRDVEAAKSFYGSVFGWQTLTLDGGPGMWTLPGYGDHLEQTNPDLRKQMAEGGAPAGFEDVVASIDPIPDDQPGRRGTLGGDLRSRRCRRHGREGNRAGRQGDRRAVRCPLGQDDRDHRPSGRDIHHEQVRARESGSRRSDGRDGRHGIGTRPPRTPSRPYNGRGGRPFTRSRPRGRQLSRLEGRRAGSRDSDIALPLRTIPWQSANPLAKPN